jgi:hypothetical protein
MEAKRELSGVLFDLAVRVGSAQQWPRHVTPCQAGNVLWSKPFATYLHALRHLVPALCTAWTPDGFTSTVHVAGLRAAGTGSASALSVIGQTGAMQGHSI